jgi:hypothetical protein
VVVGGECPTVGIAGGYTQGGGHSALSTEFGLAADQTLSFEIVTAAGELVTASRSENSDLYWALSGGGAGNYGIVVSMVCIFHSSFTLDVSFAYGSYFLSVIPMLTPTAQTVKTYPDAPVGGAELEFLSAYTTPDLFYEAIAAYYSLLPAIIDNGTMVISYFTDQFFTIKPVTAYNKTAADVKAILAPFVDALNSLEVPFSVEYTEFDSYYDHYSTFMGPLPYGWIGAEQYQFGSRLIPRSAVQDNNTSLQTALRNITENGVLVVSVSLDVSAPVTTGNASNAVLPAWRDAISHTYLTTAWNSTAPWSDMVHLSDLMTDEYIPQLDSVLPATGSYMNEADFREPRYKEIERYIVEVSEMRLNDLGLPFDECV